jgi:hypothetical protein
LTRHYSFAWLAPLVVACGAETSSSHASVRDSAGILIVENRAPGPATPAFQVSAAPEVVIGAADTIAMEQFALISGVRRLASGEIVVTDYRSGEVRAFEGSGRFARLVGRRGEGPGEYGQLYGLLSDAEFPVEVWDASDHRLTRYSATGEFLGMLDVTRPPSVALPGGGRAGFYLDPLGRLSNGEYFATGGPSRAGMPDGVTVDSQYVWRIDSVGGIHHFATVFTRVRYFHHRPDGSTTLGPMPFGPKGSLAVGDSGWFHSGGSTFETREYRNDGSLRRIMRVARESGPIKNAARERFILEALEGLPEEAAARERGTFEWLKWPETMPAYDALIHDTEGHLWARLTPDTASTVGWDVFDAEGRLVATASTPSTLDVKQIGPDWLLALSKGEMDEPLVYLYRLKR